MGGIDRVLTRCGTAQPRRGLRHQSCRVSWTFLGTTGTIYQSSAGPFHDVIKAAEYAVLRGANAWKVIDPEGLVLGVHCDVAGILGAAIDEGLQVEVIGA